MTAYVPTASSISAAVIFNSVAANDSLTLLQPFTFITTNVNAVIFGHNNLSLLNMTTLMSGGSYAVVVNSVDDCDIVNTATGTIAALSGTLGYVGVYMFGDRNTLQNAGQIYSSNGTGVAIAGDAIVVDNSGTIRGREIGLIANGPSYSILNSGTIEAGSGALSSGVYLTGNSNAKFLVNTGIIQTLAVEGGTGVTVVGGGLATLENSGTIRSVGGIALDASASTGAIKLTNSGELIGSATFVYALVGTAMSDLIVNTGTINRAVALGDGADVYMGLGGHVGGTIFGGEGGDTYYTDDADIAIFEDSTVGEIDQLFARTSFTLAANIENLTLIGNGDFRGTGNLSDNLIFGNGGDNRLNGLAGVDTLLGQLGNDHLNGGGQADSLDGQDGEDTLLGGIGNDTLKGGEGDDVLNGGASKDTITTGAGADTVLFTALGHTASSMANADILTDFDRGEDVIDLSSLDAKATNAAPNDTFIFIADAAFTNIAGQLRYEQTGGNTFLHMDTNGDGLAEAIIRLNGLYTLNASDFVL